MIEANALPLSQTANLGPEEVKAKQKEDNSLKKYWDLLGKPVEVGKPHFFLTKGILYRKNSGKKDTDKKIQLVSTN